MIFRGFMAGFLIVGTLFATAVGEEELPADVVNVALPEFGDRIGPGSDYGLANIEPVEVGWGVGRGREIRIVRTPRELRLSRRNEARFQVRLGEVKGVYFWIEAPPVHGQWHVSLTVVYPDGYRETIFSKDMRREGINFAWVPPRALLEIQVSSIEQTFKLSKRFIFTVSPVLISLWPNFLPVPNKSLWE